MSHQGRETNWRTFSLSIYPPEMLMPSPPTTTWCLSVYLYTSPWLPGDKIVYSLEANAKNTRTFGVIISPRLLETTVEPIQTEYFKPQQLPYMQTCSAFWSNKPFHHRSTVHQLVMKLTHGQRGWLRYKILRAWLPASIGGALRTVATCCKL